MPLYFSVHNPGHSILVLARSERQAGLLQKVLVSAAILGIPRKRYQGRPHCLELPNGWRIFAIAHGERIDAGHTAHVVIVDEAALVADTVFGAVLRSLIRTKGKLWLLSTPAGQTGIFYSIWHDEKLTEWLRIRAPSTILPMPTRRWSRSKCGSSPNAPGRTSTANSFNPVAACSPASASPQ